MGFNSAFKGLNAGGLKYCMYFNQKCKQMCSVSAGRKPWISQMLHFMKHLRMKRKTPFCHRWWC